MARWPAASTDVSNDGESAMTVQLSRYWRRFSSVTRYVPRPRAKAERPEPASLDGRINRARRDAQAACDFGHGEHSRRVKLFGWELLMHGYPSWASMPQRSS